VFFTTVIRPNVIFKNPELLTPFWNRWQNWKIIGSGVCPMRAVAATAITIPSSVNLYASHLI
jgi:hypothetical protein